MILKEKERAALEDLQTQEKSCVEKYEKYANQARDPELKSLFRRRSRSITILSDRYLQEQFRNVTATTAQDVITNLRPPIMT